MILADKPLNNPLFDFQYPIGYGLVQMYGNEGDIPYAATRAALSAATALTTEQPDELLNLLVAFSCRAVGFVFPVVAISGELYSATLADSGEIEVIKEERAILISQSTSGDMPTTVTILTESALGNFASACIGGAKNFFEEQVDRAKKAKLGRFPVK